MTPLVRCRDAGDGTSLAAGRGVASSSIPLSPEAMWRRARDHFFVIEAKQTSRYIMGIGACVQLATFALLLGSGYPQWRVGALLAAYCVFSGCHRAIMRCTSEPSKVSASFIYMSVASLVFVTVSAALTGGVHSIFLPSLVMPAIVSLMFFGPQAVARWVAVANALLIIAVVTLPESIVGPQLSERMHMVGIIISLTWFLFMLHALVGKLSVVASRAGESVACLREERIGDAEAQLRRLQSVGAKVAHELKNPLASIKGLCQLVARTPESERTQERLAVATSEIARMETILREYLSFSRPLEDLKPESIDLIALGRDVLDVLDGRAVNAGVTTSVGGTAAPVQGDPRRLKEALINLVSNAIEATPSGGTVALKVRSSAVAVVIDVVDSGRGISADDMSRMGTSFFTTRENGTGLGVVLAQGVITQHGGSLKYDSKVGRGTTASISLPTPGARPALIAEPSARAPLAQAHA